MDLVQGTEAWHQFRKKGIGASEIAAIIGVCPYSTPLMVFNVKTGRSAGFEGNSATQRGSELESKARALYEILSMEDMEPACVIHPKYEIIRASLDGITADKTKILEIKCLGKDSHAAVKAGQIPPHYLPQVQYQLAASGADRCDFFSFGADESHGLIEVLPDIEYQGMLVAKALEFWELVKADTPPPMTDRDFKIVEDPAVVELCEYLIKWKDSIRKEKLDKLKAQIMELSGHPKMKCGVVQISAVNRLGKFSYHRLTISENAG